MIQQAIQQCQLTSALLVQAVEHEMFTEPMFCQQAMLRGTAHNATTGVMAAAAPFAALEGRRWTIPSQVE